MRLQPKQKRNGQGLFQSTHPRGMRQAKKIIAIYKNNISIHASAWDATLTCVHCLLLFIKFQSTHPRGMRPSKIINISFVSGFQSTHPRGMRLTTSSATIVWRIYFNPRIRVGCDVISTSTICLIRISIHASAWDATGASLFYSRTPRFQSTHPRGMRLWLLD